LGSLKKELLELFVSLEADLFYFEVARGRPVFSAALAFFTASYRYRVSHLVRSEKAISVFVQVQITAARAAVEQLE
jgi:hypothetical protein